MLESLVAPVETREMEIAAEAEVTEGLEITADSDTMIKPHKTA